MKKEMYNYTRIEAQLVKEREQQSEIKRQHEQNVKASFNGNQLLLIEEEKQPDQRTGDPFKDFALDLKKVKSEEAISYIKKGREATYDFIDLLYRKDWKLD